MAQDKNTELFDDAQDSFIRVKDLAGRSCVIFPTGLDKATGDNGKEYEYVEADVIILDGKPTELIESVPMVAEAVRFTSKVIVGGLKRKVGSGRPVLAKINTRPGKFGNPAYGMEPQTDTKVRALAAQEIEKYNEAAQAADDFA